MKPMQQQLLILKRVIYRALKIILSKPQLYFVFHPLNGPPKQHLPPKRIPSLSWLLGKICNHPVRVRHCVWFFRASGHNYKSLLSLKAVFEYRCHDCSLWKLSYFSSSLCRTLGNTLAELFGSLPANIPSSAFAYKSDFWQKQDLK